jgi:hypothetical protein
MKKTLVPIFLLFAGTLFSCKKFVQQQEQNALVTVVTSGTWRVSRYLENDSDITNSFSGYAFKFNTDGTVNGINVDSVVNGTWSGNLAARTITSNFPTAGSPVNKLNAVWKITDSYTDSVAASSTVNGATHILNLHKN